MQIIPTLPDLPEETILGRKVGTGEGPPVALTGEEAGAIINALSLSGATPFGNTIARFDVTGAFIVKSDAYLFDDGSLFVFKTEGSAGTAITAETTEAGAAAGPNLKLLRSSASPAAADNLGRLDISGRNSLGAEYSYAQFGGAIVDTTSGSEDGVLEAYTAIAGTLARRLRIGAGLYMEGATGGDPGAGKINATEVQVNGIKWVSGAGTPEGAVTAPVGSLYSRTDGGAGTTLYVKESGSGNTGWIGK